MHQCCRPPLHVARLRNMTEYGLRSSAYMCHYSLSGPSQMSFKFQIRRLQSRLPPVPHNLHPGAWVCLAFLRSVCILTSQRLYSFGYNTILSGQRYCISDFPQTFDLSSCRRRARYVCNISGNKQDISEAKHVQ